MESTVTGPRLFADVPLAVAPWYTRENVPDVVGFVVQLPFVDQLLLAAVPDQVVIVPAEAVLAATSPIRVSNVRRRAIENILRVLKNTERRNDSQEAKPKEGITCMTTSSSIN
jgi:hypothetical protein